jgi:hypothetical protein
MARLDAGNPRIMVDSATGTRPDQMASTLTVMPYMMDPGEEKIVADALFAAMSKPGKYEDPAVPKGAMAKLSGNWAVTIQYVRGQGEQQFTLQQDGASLTGSQKGEIYQGAITGTVRANTLEMVSRMPVPGSVIDWRFKGTVTGNNMSGTVNLGEYGIVPWTAVKA